ncbi:MAG: T9SS type A sorting domain-containing protein [Bacteroidetes bacterium]|nr:T9SS type A sorting domain-containing protein [Bacteroidota bacterium]
MRNFFYIFSISLFASVCDLQAQPTLQWQKSLGGSIIDYAADILRTQDGGYLVAGNALSNNGNVTGNKGASDFWVVKLDVNGLMQWQKTYGGSGYDEAKALAPTADGGFVVFGNSTSNNGQVSINRGGSDFWAVKISATGALVWQKSFGGTDNELARAAVACPDGGFLLLGTTYSKDGDVSGNHGSGDFWAVKINAEGILQWQKTYGGSLEEEAADLQNTPDGGFVLAGQSLSSDGDLSSNKGIQDFWIVKISATGNLQWQKSLGGNSYDWAFAIQNLNDGNIAVAGSSFSNTGDVTGNHGGSDFWVVKLSPNGELIWQKSIGGSDSDEAYALLASPDNGMVVAGYAASSNGDLNNNKGGWDFWIAKLDANGNLKWQKNYGGSANDLVKALVGAEDGGFVLAGDSRSNDGDVSGNHGNFDYWVVKLSAFVLAANDPESETVWQLAPNPTQDQLQIRFEDPANTYLMRVLNLSGQVLWQQKVHNSAEIQMKDWPAAVYLVQAISENGTLISRKLVKE